MIGARWESKAVSLRKTSRGECSGLQDCSVIKESSSQEIFASCKSDSIRSQVTEKLCFITQTDAKGKGGNGDVALGEATGTNHLQAGKTILPNIIMGIQTKKLTDSLCYP